MRSISRWTLVVAVTLSLLIPVIGSPAPEPTSSSSSQRKAAKKSTRKKSSKVSKRGSARASTRGRKRGRYARSRRGRRNVARASEPSPRPGASIAPERVTEIQSALIKFGYLEGPASGQYDDSTTDAMKRFQGDNRLSATGLPSAHTLKRLGVSKRSNDGYAIPVKRDGD